jgi:cytoplasmic iron level regulating protein YaaA (DUF328/UPF0246 family)
MWLDENLQNPFRANSEKLPVDDSSRGIYFWFMKPEGYRRLSALGLKITAIIPTHNKVINGVPYDLVYIGTAGANRKENNTLFKRLNWHLSDKHTENSICHEVLSTLRQTVGAALSNDLILPNTMNLVNEYFNSHFYVFVLSYPRTLHNALDIDKDEKKLISEIKPLLNIKNNPNALNNAISNPTKALILRRKAILKQTQKRLGCIKKGDNKEKAKSKNSRNLTNTPPQNNKLNSTNNCIEFHVKKDESIQDTIKNIKGIPNQEFTIELFEKNERKNKIYEKRSGTRKTNIIYKYFGNTDNNQPRWKVIQQEMLDKGIEEITVRVCSDGPNESNEVEPSNEKRGRGRPKKNETNKTEVLPMNKPQVLEKLENRKKDEPVLLILGCSDSKARGGTEIQNNYFNSECLNNKRVQTINNYNQSIAAHPNKFNKNRNGNPVNANYFGNCQNEYREALDRYCTNRSIFYKPNQIALYRQKINEGKLHILILSGLYGVLKWDDRIIDYHYKFNSLNSLYNADSCVLDNIQKYIADNNIKGENVFYSLSNNGRYQEMLTANIPNNWSFVWINGGRGHKTASFLFNDFLPAL